jgi:hypothetical protein
MARFFFRHGQISELGLIVSALDGQDPHALFQVFALRSGEEVIG